MFSKIRRSIKAQSTAEYAIMLGLVIAAIVAMQIYVQRTIKGKVFDAARYLSNAGMEELTNGDSATLQYEPYYLDSTYTTARKSTQFASGGNLVDSVVSGSSSDSARRGVQTYSYNAQATTPPGATQGMTWGGL
jgi:hypothetical protein